MPITKKNIYELIQRISHLFCFDAGSRLLEKIESMPCDILFLDIDMPEINGMDIAKVLSGLYRPPLLVFVTGHDELVYESLQYHPFGFIRKDYFKQEIEKEISFQIGQGEMALT